MVPLVLMLGLVEAALIGFSFWVGFQLYTAGHHGSAMLYGVVLGCVMVHKTSRLIGNLVQEHTHRRKYFSDLPAYRWWSTESELFSRDKNGRHVSASDIRQRYR